MQGKVFSSRTASVCDIASIGKLSDQLDFGISMTRLNLLIFDAQSKVTVLRHKDELMGFAISGDFVCGEVTLMNIAVVAAHRKNGFGKKMLIEHMDFWKKKGAVKCLLELRASNSLAKTFYSQFGFVCEGIRAKYYKNRNGREDAILMTLNF